MMPKNKLWIVMSKNRKFFEDLGERIVNRRKELGMTQTELGEMVGVTQQVIASYETARRQIPAWRVTELAKALDMPLEALMGLHARAPKRGPKSVLEKQVSALQRLPKKDQELASQLLDKLLASAH